MMNRIASTFRPFGEVFGRILLPLSGLLALLLLQVPSCFGLEPAQILVVYNSTMPESIALASYYQQKRAVPPGNLFGLPLPHGEFISRSDYERQLAQPLRDKLAEPSLQHRISALLLIDGVPLKVGPDLPPEKSWTDTLSMQRQAIGMQMSTLLNRLAAIIELPSAATAQLPALQDLEKRWKSVEDQLPVWQRKHNKDQDFTAQSAEVQTLLIRLNGLAPVARNILQKTREALRKDSLDKLVFLSSLVDQQLNLLRFDGVTGDNLLSALSLRQLNNGLIGAYAFLSAEQQQPPDEDSSASVDSELSLILRPSYQTGRWLANPFAQQYDPFPGIEHLRRNTLMVCRLDAPTPDIVRRLIDDALYAETHGLSGNFYIDARGLKGDDKKKDLYSEYDRHLEMLYTKIKDNCPLPVVFDDRQELFAEGAELPAALYVGWYSLGKYVDAFAWQRGAVGFHVASIEARTLHDKDSTVWCKMMLEKGVAATLGPTEEPYLQSFPLPDQFFPLLLEGKLPLLEVYYRTLPSLSWRQVLIGDPLYRPFAKRTTAE